MKLTALTSQAGLWDGGAGMRRLRRALLVSFSYFLRVAAAQAEPSAPPPAAAAPPEAVAPSPPATPTPPRLAGFDILASVGYAPATTTVGDLKLEPYSATFGLDLGYTFRSGFRVGGAFGYGLGRSVKQSHDPRIGRDYDMTTDSSILNMATSLGWDVPLFFLTLRYTMNLGVSVMWWDFGDVPPQSAFNNLVATSPALGIFVAPGVTALYRHGLLECGLGFDYFVQSNDAIPPGFLGKLLVGVKL